MTELDALIEELTKVFGPRWETETSERPTTDLAWTFLSDDVSCFVSIIGQRGPWNRHELRIDINEKDQINGWALYAPAGEPLLIIPGWHSLREAMMLAGDFLVRSSRVERALGRSQ